MYIQKIQIKNLRAIQDLTLDFGNSYPGWHVILGDNGTGKSSVLRAISVALIGNLEILRLDPTWETWVRIGEKKVSISINIVKKSDFDKKSGSGAPTKGEKKINTVEGTLEIEGKLEIVKEEEDSVYKIINKSPKNPDIYRFLWGTGAGWFSVGFGAFRRFTGGTQSLERFYSGQRKIAAHLTLFKEDAALTEIVVWIKELQLKSDSYKDTNAKMILDGIRNFYSSNDLLPQGFNLSEMKADGLYFKNQNGVTIHLYELSEGIKSILSLSMELLRNLCAVYDTNDVFKYASEQRIDCEGVVLIDEIDAHLHPAWQTRIGQWFTTAFPNIQFIVTTHSPFICRSCNNKDNEPHGIIWQLKDKEPNWVKIEGDMRNKLVYGNILDAFSTDLFGTDIERSANGQKNIERLAFLSNKRIFDKSFTPDETIELTNLQNIFSNNLINAADII